MASWSNATDALGRHNASDPGSNDYSNSSEICPYFTVSKNVYFLTFARFIPYTVAIILNSALFLIILDYRLKKSAHSGDQYQRRSFAPGLPFHLLLWNFCLAAIIRSVAAFANTVCVVVYEITLPVDEYPVLNWFFHITVYSTMDTAHVTFCLLVSLHTLFYFLRPLHYRKLITTRRSVIACSLTWILGVLDVVWFLSASGYDYYFVGTILLEAAPILFSLVTALITTYMVRKLGRRTSSASAPDSAAERNDSTTSSGQPRRHSGMKQRPIWRTALRSLQGTIVATIFFVPSSVYNMIIHMCDFKVTCSTFHVASIFLTGILSRLYLCGLPLVILSMHPMYWRHLKRMLKGMRKRRLASAAASDRF